ncbi:TRAP transporter small permease [Sedimentitalea nanhaiensis]|uniref:TRAP transporter small permease protein n=1 Tax=Sedimentitalea nanhaiensis TaxID=999627 RepID=A0A1I7CKD2_9RHOB|nr:TRAP transporter small permease subunit [Sedimentitalea nanhaiensis]SFT99878.1 TRAP-type C4-dicarboxylate transport system, small permease component [Sedimentitalea nanhaiensis]
MSALATLSQRAGLLSQRINSVVEIVIAILLVLLVLDVWLAVLDRYAFHWQLPWPEVLARFLMIWAALLGVSSGVARREHIGLGLMVQRLPVRLKAVILISVDALVLFLFIALFFFGLEFAEKGASRQAQILGATLLIPFASIPACALLCIVQTILVGLRDMGHYAVGGSPDDILEEENTP